MVKDLSNKNKQYVDQLILATNENVNSKVMLLDGTHQLPQNVSWSENKLTNLANPTQGQDAVNEMYLDYLLKMQEP